MDLPAPSEQAGLPAEVEIKFAVSPADLRRLARLPLLAGAEPKRRTLASTYFDTEDHDLLRRALTLRIRRDGRRYLQTLKQGSPSAAANFARPAVG